MRYYRRNNNWLKYRILTKIRTDHKELYEPPLKKIPKDFFRYLFDRKNWLVILILIILIYVLGAIINLSFLNFINLNVSTSKIIVDQRTSNTATIVSMTLAVVGFLMSNLAVKESFSYKLLFKNSKLYPIIYFILSTIGSLMIISLLRDTIRKDIFSKLVITGTYLVIIVLFMIGYLFRSIIHFTNSTKIQDLLHSELMEEAKKNLKNTLLRKYSLSLFDLLMQENGAKEYNFSTAFDISTSEPISTGEPKIVEFSDIQLADFIPKGKYLIDINISKILKFVSSKKEVGGIYYKRIQIGKVTTETDNYIWAQTVENSEKEKKKLKKYLILKKNFKLENPTYDVRNYFDSKLEEYSMERKHHGIDLILKSYLELYELEMKNQIL